jgi:hypothetical protein
MPWYVWAFDGVGGAVAVAIIGYFLRRKSQPEIPSISANLHSVSDSNVVTGNNVNQQIVQHHHHLSDRSQDLLKSTEPSPGQIMSDLKTLPPYEKRRAEENYRGLPVLWQLALSDIASSGGNWTVLFRTLHDSTLIGSRRPCHIPVSSSRYFGYPEVNHLIYDCHNCSFPTGRWHSQRETPISALRQSET